MIYRLSEQLRNETPRHSHGYVVLSLLTVIVFAGWFIYHGVTNSAQAQSAIITGSYTSPVIGLNLAENEFITAIEGTIINEVVPDDASINYQFSFYSDESGFTPVVTDVDEPGLSDLGIDTLSPVKAYSFTVELTGTVGSEMPVVDSVELLYTTETTTEPEPEEPADQHIPNLSISFSAKVDYGFGEADPNLPFYFYFFKENASVPAFTSAPTTTYSSTMDQYIGGPISVSSSEYGLEAATYKAYIKTPKHLSSQSNDVVVELQTGLQVTTVPFELNFGTLKAGDIGGNDLPYGSLQNRDDSITVSDWAIFEGLFGDIGEIVTTLLGDFNNDGSVNVHDMWPFRSQSDGGNYQLGGGL